MVPMFSSMISKIFSMSVSVSIAKKQVTKGTLHNWENISSSKKYSCVAILCISKWRNKSDVYKSEKVFVQKILLVFGQCVCSKPQNSWQQSCLCATSYKPKSIFGKWKISECWLQSHLFMHSLNVHRAYCLCADVQENTKWNNIDDQMMNLILLEYTTCFTLVTNWCFLLKQQRLLERVLSITPLSSRHRSQIYGMRQDFLLHSIWVLWYVFNRNKIWMHCAFGTTKVRMKPCLVLLLSSWWSGGSEIHQFSQVHKTTNLHFAWKRLHNLLLTSPSMLWGKVLQSTSYNSKDFFFRYHGGGTWYLCHQTSSLKVPLLWSSSFQEEASETTVVLNSNDGCIDSAIIIHHVHLISCNEYNDWCSEWDVWHSQHSSFQPSMYCVQQTNTCLCPWWKFWMFCVFHILVVNEFSQVCTTTTKMCSTSQTKSASLTSVELDCSSTGAWGIIITSTVLMIQLYSAQPCGAFHQVEPGVFTILP